ncbi:hypothetical protein niasHT_029723 [Heterodera trifolii]|uniref:polynucleotide adenylyltransferase n=1 Tax=Heterodera trifolii TaxID=157864 RepID=A0ABD2KSD7_9BILA
MGINDAYLLEEQFPYIMHIDNFFYIPYLDSHLYQFEYRTGSAKALAFECRNAVRRFLASAEWQKSEQNVRQKADKGTPFGKLMFKKLNEVKKAALAHDSVTSAKGICLLVQLRDYLANNEQMEEDTMGTEEEKVRKWWPNKCDQKEKAEWVLEVERVSLRQQNRECYPGFMVVWGQLVKVRGAPTRLCKLLQLSEWEIELEWWKNEKQFTDEDVFRNPSLLELHYIRAFSTDDSAEYEALKLAADLFIWVMWFEKEILQLENEHAKTVPRLTMAWKQNRWYYEMTYDKLFDIEKQNERKALAKIRQEIGILLQESKKFVEQKLEMTDANLKIELRSKRLQRLQQPTRTAPPFGTLDRELYDIRRKAMARDSQVEPEFEQWLQQTHFNRLSDYVSQCNEFNAKFVKGTSKETLKGVAEFVGEENVDEVNRKANDCFGKLPNFEGYSVDGTHIHAIYMNTSEILEDIRKSEEIDKEKEAEEKPFDLDATMALLNFGGTDKKGKMTKKDAKDGTKSNERRKKGDRKKQLKGELTDDPHKTPTEESSNLSINLNEKPNLSADECENGIMPKSKENSMEKSKKSDSTQKLSEFLLKNGYGLIDNDRRARIDHALRQIENVVRKWYIAAKFVLTGSYQFGALTNDADIDAICVVPDSLIMGAQRFFGSAKCEFQSANIRICRDNSLFCKLCLMPNTVKISRIRDAWVPIIGLTLAIDQTSNISIDLDISFTALSANDPIFQFRDPINYALSDALSFRMAYQIDQEMANSQQQRASTGVDLVPHSVVTELTTRLRSLAGFEVSTIILNLLNAKEKGTQEERHIQSSFCTLLLAIKMWAKEHHIYDNKLGFFNGISLSILVAKVMLLYPMASMPFLLEKFFFTFSTWPWPIPVKLTDWPRMWSTLRWSAKEEMHKRNEIYSTRGLGADLALPIVTPGHIEQNATFNMNKSSVTIIQREMQNATETIRNWANLTISWEDKFDSLLKGQIFEEKYAHYIRITCKSASLADFDDFCGYAETRIRLQLLIDIERFDHIRLAHGKQIIANEQFTEEIENKNGTKNGLKRQFYRKIWLVGIELDDNIFTEEKHNQQTNLTKWSQRLNSMLSSQFEADIVRAYRIKKNLMDASLNAELSSNYEKKR